MIIYYMERDGRKYMYAYTPKRVPGKNYLISQREHLVVVGPETGN